MAASGVRSSGGCGVTGIVVSGAVRFTETQSVTDHGVDHGRQSPDVMHVCVARDDEVDAVHADTVDVDERRAGCLSTAVHAGRPAGVRIIIASPWPTSMKRDSSVALLATPGRARVFAATAVRAGRCLMVRDRSSAPALGGRGGCLWPLAAGWVVASASTSIVAVGRGGWPSCSTRSTEASRASGSPHVASSCTVDPVADSMRAHATTPSRAQRSDMHP